ncbi:MAG: FemAB family XrtA/PEP-CTERM system-associated protein [Pseudomonadota bacterium]
MSTGIIVHRLEGADLPRWDDYVLATPRAENYHLAGWGRVIQASFGHGLYYLLAEEGGKVAGVLPLAQVRSRAFGNHLVSLPFFNYGGIIAEDEAAEKALFEAAVHLAEHLKADSLELRHSTALPWFAELPDGLAGGHPFTRRHKLAMRLVLPASAEELWDGFKSKLRSQIRKPLKEGCRIEIGGSELAGDFYRVFAENMRDLGTPVYSPRFFRNVLAEFPQAAKVAVVYHRGGAVAAGLVVGFRQDTLEIPWASSLRRGNHLSPNMLLYWGLLEHACRAGYRRFDFGRSSVESNTARFKAQWGASPEPLHWHGWSSRRSSGAGPSPDNPRFALAIRLWKRLPLAVANVLGPPLVKYIP